MLYFLHIILYLKLPVQETAFWTSSKRLKWTPPPPLPRNAHMYVLIFRPSLSAKHLSENIQSWRKCVRLSKIRWCGRGLWIPPSCWPRVICLVAILPGLNMVLNMYSCTCHTHNVLCGWLLGYGHPYLLTKSKCPVSIVPTGSHTCTVQYVFCVL